MRSLVAAVLAVSVLTAATGASAAELECEQRLAEQPYLEVSEEEPPRHRFFDPSCEGGIGAAATRATLTWDRYFIGAAEVRFTVDGAEVARITCSSESPSTSFIVDTRCYAYGWVRQELAGTSFARYMVDIGTSAHVTFATGEEGHARCAPGGPCLTAWLARGTVDLTIR